MSNAELLVRQIEEIVTLDNIDRFIGVDGGRLSLVSENLGLQIDFAVSFLRPNDSTFFAQLPDDFIFPVYEINIFNSKEVVTTPYGDLNRYVVGTNDRVYLVTNSYYVDQSGKRLKLETVDDIDEEFDPNDQELKDAQRVGFVPQPSDTRFVPLENRDSLRLTLVLKKISRGELQILESV